MKDPKVPDGLTVDKQCLQKTPTARLHVQLDLRLRLTLVLG